MNRLLSRATSCGFILLIITVCLGQSGITYSVFPQIAVGDGWSFDIFVTNQDSDSASGVRLSFFKSSGEPLACSTSAGSGAVFTFNLQGGATQSVRVSNEGALRAGYAVLEAPSSISVRGSLVVRYEQGGRVVTQLGVTQQFPGTVYSFPVEVNSDNEINTGVAVALPEFSSSPSDPGDVVVSLVDERGSLQRTAALKLSRGQHQACYLNQAQLFPGLDHFRGSVSVASAVPFGLIALRQEQSVFGTLAISRGPVTAPHFVSSAAVSESEPNGTNPQASALVPPARVSGAFGARGDLDLYKFTGTRGDILTALTDTRSFGFQADTVLALMKEDGSLLCANDQSGVLSNNDSFLQAVLPADGTYYLRVEEHSGAGGTGFGYQLHVKLSGPSGQPGLPRIDSISPSSALPGNSLQITIRGSSLAGAASINFTPWVGVLITNVQATPSQITATLTLYATAATGARQVTVTTAAGDSNALPFTVTAPQPQPPTIDSIAPSSATVGSTVNLEIWGTNVSGATGITFTPSAGITTSNLSSTTMRVLATVAIEATAATGARQVTVTTPGGTSNSRNFTVRSATPVGQPPTISNLQVGSPVTQSNTVRIPVSFSFSDPDGDITYTPGNMDLSARVTFSKTGCTKTFSGTTINRPGQTSGSFSLELVLTGTTSGSYSINVQLIDAAGNGSNILSFTTTVWNCLLLERPWETEQAPVQRSSSARAWELVPFSAEYKPGVG